MLKQKALARCAVDLYNQLFHQFNCLIITISKKERPFFEISPFLIRKKFIYLPFLATSGFFMYKYLSNL